MTFLSPNSRIQNRYLIKRQIGEGGMGAVYEATDERLGHQVALKQTIISDDELKNSVQREAQILAGLDHPALPHVSDYFTSNTDQFLVMKYIPGDDLETLLYKQKRPFQVQQVVTWMFELLDALEYLHSQKPPIIHRDIKPANLKLSAQNKIILLDFGISKGGLGNQSKSISHKSIYAFTPYYAPLEQINAQGTDQRSDLYSLAATFYHLLTATELPTATTRAGAKINQTSDPLLLANQLNPQVPFRLAHLLAQAMSLNPAERPQSASAMRAALQAIWQPSPYSQTGAPNQFPKTELASPPPLAPYSAAPSQSQPGSPAFPKTVVSRSRPKKDTAGSNYGAAYAGGGYGQQPSPPYDPRVGPHATPTPPATPKSKSWLPIAILAFVGIAILGLLLFIVLNSSFNESESVAVVTETPKPTLTRLATESNQATNSTLVKSPSTETPTLEPTLTESPTLEPTLTETPVVEPTPTNTPTPEATPTEPSDGDIRFSEKDGMKMFFLSAGEFLMGSLDDDPLAKEYPQESPQHSVYLDGFWIDETEVTVSMFARFVEETGYETYAEGEKNAYVYQGEGKWEKIDGAYWKYPRGPNDDSGNIDDHPVVQVSWNDAREYCEWAGRRLPTEAEWEKAARGTDGRLYPWGNQEVAGNLLNFCDYNCPKEPAERNYDDGYVFTAPVGSYPEGASPIGALDMLGNVWEWVADWYDASYYSQAPAENPLGPDIGEQRVLRGGSWSNDSGWTRSAFRHRDPPADPNDERGFRCASDP